MEKTIEECFSYIQNGANIKQGEVDGGFPITRIETTANDKFNRDRMGYAGITDISKYKSYVLEDGDLLMSHINSVQYLGRTVLYEKQDDEIIIHGMNLLRLKARKNIIHPAYARYCFYAHPFRKQVANITKKSVNQASFAVKDLKKIKIEVPTMARQYEVVTILNKISDLIGLRQQQLQKLDELVKARFVEMFGDPVSNPKRWRTEKVDKHINLLSGFAFDSSQYTDRGVNICGGLIIMPQKIGWDGCKHWGSIDGYEDYSLQANDIVMALDRPWISEGFKIAMVDQEHLPALLIQRTARIRAVDVNQYYLMQCFVLGRFDRHCNITGSLVPHISAKDIQSFLIMLPPLELQNQFAAFVEQVDKSKAVVRKALA
jgi:type I restriction enzyme S subunit